MANCSEHLQTICYMKTIPNAASFRNGYGVIRAWTIRRYEGLCGG